MTEEIGAAIRRTAETVEASPDLRDRVDHLRRPRLSGARQRLTLGIAVAAVAVLFGVFVGGHAPSVTAVAQAALAAPQSPATGERAYGDWQPVGERTDTVGGRRSHTVIYQQDGTGVHYAIVDGKPLDLPGGRRERRHGVTYALARDGDINVVAWHRDDGKTCVLASKMEDLDGLLKFAAYGR
jgi:hypothetical protein